MKSVSRLEFDIEDMPSLNSPIMGIFIDPNIEMGDSHIQFILDAVRDCREIIYNQD